MERKQRSVSWGLSDFYFNAVKLLGLSHSRPAVDAGGGTEASFCLSVLPAAVLVTNDPSAGHKSGKTASSPTRPESESEDTENESRVRVWGGRAAGGHVSVTASCAVHIHT